MDGDRPACQGVRIDFCEDCGGQVHEVINGECAGCLQRKWVELNGLCRQMLDSASGEGTKVPR